MLKKIKISDIEKLEIIVETTTDNQIYAKYKPDYILNLSLYDTSSGKNITYIKDNGETSGYLFSSVGLGITHDNKPIWINREYAYKDDTIKDYCSFSPVLVQNGKKCIDWGNKVSSYVNGNHHRSFCGFNDEYFFIGASDNKNTIDGLANYCVQQGMKYAGNNDGNGSVSLWENGKALKDSGRRNASWLCIWLKKDKPQTDKEVYEVEKEIITVDGAEMEFETITVNGKTYMEMRKLAETVDYMVVYDPKTKKKSINRKK